MSELLTIGYTEPDAQQRIDTFLANENAALVDIRLSPRSHWQPFNKAALETRYPAQYIHVPEMGNVNYKPANRHLGIDLLDAQSGMRQLLYLLGNGRSLMLLCACKDYEKCHRKTVYKLVMAELRSRLKIGARVRIQCLAEQGQLGTIYQQTLNGTGWYVRPDRRPADQPGIVCVPEELDVLL